MSDEDLGDLRPSPLITLGAFMVLSAGLATAAGGLQPLVVAIIFHWMKFLPWALLGLGVLTALLGGLTARARLWALLLGMLLSLVDAAGLLVWTVWAGINGYLSPLQPLGAIIALAAVVAAGIAIPPTLRISRARRELLR